MVFRRFFSISLLLSKWENIPHKGCRNKRSDCCVVRACLFREILALMSGPLCAARVSACRCTLLTVTEGHGGEKLALLLHIQELLIHISVQRQIVLAERCIVFVNTLRTGSFKLFKRPFPGFLTILTL